MGLGRNDDGILSECRLDDDGMVMERSCGGIAIETVRKCVGGGISGIAVSLIAPSSLRSLASVS